MKIKILAGLLGVLGLTSIHAQITANGNSGMSTTAYTDGSINDAIYIWCAEGLTNNTASLTATPASGTGPWTFNWYYHNQTNSSWTDYSTETGPTSTIANLPSDGYRVQIYDNGGLLVGCYTAWVWNMNGEVTANQTPSACDESNLSGTVASNGSFTYFNPPPPESLINASTEITVCFTANHTFISDLAFYMVGPPSCGSPTILLSPNPGANGQGSVCNSGDNISNLCFTSLVGNNFDPCASPAPYSGTYSSYGPSSTAINWGGLIGCNAAQGGWAVQIYDCIGADVGSLTNANISFSNLTSVCGSPTTLNYTSGAINSVINDNSCSAGSASIFQVPVSVNLTTPITINATTTYLWTADQTVTIPNASSSLTSLVTAIPNGTTTFTLTATVSYGGATCSYDAETTFTNTCCTAVADAGSDASFCTGENTQLGIASVPDLTYSWTPTTGLSDATIAQPTVNLTNTGSSAQTITYTLTVTNVAQGGCTDTDEVDVTVFPLPTVDAGTYLPVCIDATDVALVATPAGGTFSGAGVTGSVFDPSVGTQTITYSFTDANTCSNSDQALITVNPLPTVFGGEDVTVCEGTSVTLAGVGAFSYLWTNGGVDNQPFTPSLGSMVYTVTGTDANGCVNTDDVTVTVVTVPTALVDADVIYGYPVLNVVFTNNSTSATIYGWNFDNGQVGTVTTTASQNVSYQTPGTYIIELVAGNGICSDMDTVQVVVIPFPDPIIYIPNVFTPNEDGANDEFFVTTEWVDELSVIIFNRWGNIIHEIDSLTGVWDGKINGNEASDGVYFYTYTLVGTNGSELNGHGNITLVR